jgi:hypothetical protein
MHAAHWAEHRRVADPAVIEEVLAAIVGGAAARDCLRRAQDKDVKDLLAQRTQAAFDSGAFGLPWFQGTYLLVCGESARLKEASHEREGRDGVLLGVRSPWATGGFFGPGEADAWALEVAFVRTAHRSVARFVREYGSDWYILISSLYNTLGRPRSKMHFQRLLEMLLTERSDIACGSSHHIS